MPKLGTQPKTPRTRKPKTVGEQTTPDPVAFPGTQVKIYMYGPSCPMTAAEFKRWLGYEEEPDGTNWGEDFLDKTESGLGRKFRLKNNPSNRPWYRALALKYKQEILNKRWVLNGQDVLFDDSSTPLAISAQHRGVALIWAVQEWEKDTKWREVWKTEPVIHICLKTGIDSSDVVVNTIDTGKPRTISDALYRTEEMRDLPRADRQAVARMVEYSIRLMWDRTGEKRDPYAPILTHQEALDFLGRHPRLIESSVKIRDIYGVGKIPGGLTPGVSAGLHYLMCVSNSDPSKYYEGDEPGTGEDLDWSMANKATQFWTDVNSGINGLNQIGRVISDMTDEETGEFTGSLRERMAVFLKAWVIYSDGREPTAKQIKPKIDDGVLAEDPTAGGIDKKYTSKEDDLEPGSISVDDEDDEDEDEEPELEEGAGKNEDDPDEEEIKERAQKLRDKTRKSKEKAGQSGKKKEKREEREQQTPKEMLRELEKKFPSALLAFRRRDNSGWNFLGTHADEVSKTLTGKAAGTDKDLKMKSYVLQGNSWEELDLLVEAKYRVITVWQTADGLRTEPYNGQDD